LKTRKLMAVLVMVALFVTALPVVALGAPVANEFDSIFEADKDEVVADGTKAVKFTVYLMDGNETLATKSSFYVASSRRVDVFTKGKPEFNENGDLENELDQATSDHVYKVETDSNGKGVFWVSSESVGTSKIGIALNETENNGENSRTLYDYLVGRDVDTTELQIIGTQKIEFTAPKIDEVEVVDVTSRYELDFEEDQIEAAIEDSKDALTGVNANALDYYDVTFKVNPRAKGETIKFSVNKSAATLSKTSATTNVLGEASVKVYASKTGVYKLTAKVGKKDVSIYLRFGAGEAFALAVDKGDDAVVALDHSHEIKIKLLDVNGATVDAGSYTDVGSTFAPGPIMGNSTGDENDKEVIEVEVITEPEDSDIEDDLEYKVSKKLLVIKTPELEEEGKYTIQVALRNGKYVRVSFEAKELGDIVEMTLEYDKDDEEDNRYNPTVKLIDVDGVEVKVTGDDLDDVKFSINDTKIANILSNGTVVGKEDKEGVVVVTAVHSVEKVLATAEVRVGDVGAEGIKFTVPEELLVDEDYTIKMKVLDEDGYEVMKDAEYEVVVLSKPADAEVEVDVDDNEFTIYSDTKGTVKLIAIARVDDEDDEKSLAVSSRLTLEFLDESKPEVIGAEKVTLFIGTDYANVDGAMEDLDAPAFIDDGRTFVPVRFLAEAFGAVADWEPKDAAVETVTLTRDDMEIVIGIGDEFLTVNVDDEAVVQEFDGAARIVNDRTYLPFRAIAEAFGATVDYGTDADGYVTWVSFEQ